MLDHRRPRIYRPYFKTIVIGIRIGFFTTLVCGAIILLVVYYPEPLRTAPRGLPPVLVIAISAIVVVAVWLGIALVAFGSPSVEITETEIVSRWAFPRSTRRVPISAIIGCIDEGPFETRCLIWGDGAKTAKLPVPRFRADDGTLLPVVAMMLGGPRANRHRAGRWLNWEVWKDGERRLPEEPADRRGEAAANGFLNLARLIDG